MSKLTTMALVLIYCIGLMAVPFTMAQEDTDREDADRRTTVKSDGETQVRKTTVRNEDGDVRRVISARNVDGEARRMVDIKTAEGDRLRLQAKLDAEGDIKRRAAMKRGDEVRRLSSDELKRLRHARNERLDRVDDSGDAPKRRIAKARLDAARDKYQDRKGRHDEIVQRHQERKDEFGEARDRLQECEESGEDCSDLRNEISERAKEYLLKIIERMRNKLEQLQARFDGADSVSDEDAADAMARIEELLAKLDQIEADVKAATTKEEMKAAASDLREVWKAMKMKIKSHTYRMIGHRLGLVVKQAELLERKLNCAADSVNDADVEALLEEYDALIVEARAEFRIASSLWDENPDEAKAHIQAGQQFLKDAHEVAKKIMNLIRELGGDLSACRDRDRPDMPPETDAADVDSDEMDEEESDESDEMDEEEESDENSDETDNSDSEDSDESGTSASVKAESETDVEAGDDKVESETSLGAEVTVS